MSDSLRIDNLAFGFARDVWTLSDVSLRAAPGELIALLGPSGCGKSTLLQLIAGLLQPARGSIAIGGRPMAGVPPEHRACGIVFQDPALFGHMSVGENVAFGLRMRGMARRERLQRAEQALAWVQLDGLAPRRPASLSGGQQSRVALARALVTEPRLLLLDEPLSDLDPALRAELRDLIRALQADAEHATLMVTHDQQEAVEVADRIALLLDGSLRMVAPPRAFYERPASRAVADFFGATNFLEGYAEGGWFYSALGPLRVHDAHDGPATATIRPEAVRLGEGENTILARVVSHEHLGERLRYMFKTDGPTLQALFPPHVHLSNGQPINVHLPPGALYLLAPAKRSAAG